MNLSGITPNMRLIWRRPAREGIGEPVDREVLVVEVDSRRKLVTVQAKASDGSQKLISVRPERLFSATTFEQSAALCRRAGVRIRPLFDEVSTELEMFRRLARRYEALARAECRRQGIAPDELISDAGHAAWELVGYEAAKKEMPDVE